MKNDKIVEEKAEYRQLLYNRVKEYITGVTSGEIIACDSIKLCVRRYLKDIENTDYYINYDAIDKFWNFCYYLKIESLQKVYVPFIPECWQCFYFYCIYGFYYKNRPERRRFLRSFLTISRKNGKTTLACIQALFALVKESNYGKIYLVSQSKSTATDSALFISQQIVRNTPALLKRCKNKQYTIDYINGKSISTFKMLPCKVDALNSLRPTSAIIDELHLMKNSEIVDKMASGMNSAVNPLLSLISTRGYNSSFYQFDLEQSYKKVLKCELQDESTFIMMFEQDNESEANNPDMWVKSNPCMGTSLDVDLLKDNFEKAKLTPSSLKEFFCFNLNLWLDSKEEQFIEQHFINKAFTKGSGLNFDFFKGKDVYLGMDISKTNDLSSLVMLYYDADNKEYYIYPFIYFANNPVKRVRSRGIDLTQWLMSGEIRQCSTARIDYNMIYDDIMNIKEHCNILSLGHDGFNKEEIIPMLESQRINVEFVSQRIADISTATKLLDRIMAQEQVTAVNNAFKWQFKNVVPYRDINNNLKLDKKVSKDSIDSIAALVNSLELWRKDNENSINRTSYTPIKMNW